MKDGVKGRPLTGPADFWPSQEVFMSDWPSTISVDQEGHDFYVREMDHFILCPYSCIDNASSVHVWIQAREWFLRYMKDAHPEVLAFQFWPPTSNLTSE